MAVEGSETRKQAVCSGPLLRVEAFGAGLGIRQPRKKILLRDAFCCKGVSTRIAGANLGGTGGWIQI